MMRITPNAPFAQRAADVARELGVDPARGLDDAEVARRRAESGRNVVARQPRRAAWKIVLRQFRSIVIALLAAAALVAFFTRDLAEGFAIVGVLLINAAVGFATEWRSERALESLRIQVRASARVLRDGAQSMIDAEELVPGDIILIDPGSRIPADSRVLESAALHVEEAALTGESVPVAKSADPVNERAPLAERTSMLYLGTTATAGRATAIVTATANATELGKIGLLIREIESEPTPLERRLAALGNRLVTIVIGIGAIVAIAGIARGDRVWEMIEVGISLAVAAVPEGLPAVTTLILSVGVLRMARRHAIVRNLPAVETLGSTTVICTDKTGTLTMNRLTVRTIDARDPAELLRIGALCSDAGVRPSLRTFSTGRGISAHSVEKVRSEGLTPIGDPTEVALVVAAADQGIDVAALRAAYPKVREVPFDPTTRHMITVHETPEGGRFVALKGAPSVVCSMCDLSDEQRAELAARNEQLASQGLRVLAFASSTDDRDLSCGYTFAGFAALADPPRPDAADAVARARAAGVRVVMLTGDQVETTRAIARELRLSGDRPPVVVHARELAEKSEEDVTRLAHDTDVFARIAPEDKLRIVDVLRKAGEIVAVTGDGVNDAPALRRGDIGVAMGKSGTDVAKQTADLVLTDDNLATIVAAIEEGRTIYANIAKFVHLLFSHNLGEVVMVFAAIASGLALPLLPLQILWMNVVTDIFPAFALALEPAQPRRMRGRQRHGDILSRSFLILVGWQGAMLAAIALAAYVWALQAYGPGSHARTVALTALIAVQLGHTFNCRSRVASAISGLFDNLHVWAATATVIALQVLAISYRPLARLLDVTRPARSDLIVVAICFALPIAIVETQKFFVRTRLEHHEKRIAILAVLVLLATVIAATEPLHRFATSLIEAADPVIRQHVVAGALLFVVLSALSAMLVFFSTAILTPIAVEAFGPLPALLLLWLGWMLGAITAYGIGRLFGLGVVSWFVDPKKIAHYDERAKELVTFPRMLLFQLAVPSEIPGYVLGLAKCRFWKFLAAVALGELPFAIGAIYLGESFLERNYGLLFAIGIAGVTLSYLIVRAVARHERQLR